MYEPIDGWPLSSFIPGSFGQNKWGRGKASVGQFIVTCGLTGTKTAAGSMTADGGGEQAFTLDQSIALCGPRSTAVQQAVAAFTVDGVSVVHCPPAEAAGAVAAHINVVFGGTWGTTGVTSGSVFFWLNGEQVEVVVGSSDVAADAGDAAVLAFGSKQNLPVLATNVVPATLVLTCDSKGTQGNSYLLAWDLSQAPTGLTVTVTGGTALHTQLVPFVGGTGTEDLTNVLAANETVVIDIWAVAQTDSTNAGLVKAFVEAQAGPLVQHLESAHFGHNGTYAAATTFASSTLNHQQCVLGWERNSESHPAVIAANMAALRSSRVGANPNTVYSGLELKGVAPQRYNEDKPGLTEQDAALHSGVTVVMQQTKGAPPVIVRDVVTKCLTGTTPNYNTLGWPHVDVPFHERKQFGAEYLQRRLVNPSAGPDPAEGESAALPGLETPRSLQAAFTVIKKANEGQFWVRDVDTNPVQVWWDSARNCLMYYNPCLVGYQNLQCGGTTAQTV